MPLVSLHLLALVIIHTGQFSDSKSSPSPLVPCLNLTVERTKAKHGLLSTAFHFCWWRCRFFPFSASDPPDLHRYISNGNGCTANYNIRNIIRIFTKKWMHGVGSSILVICGGGGAIRTSAHRTSFAFLELFLLQATFTYNSLHFFPTLSRVWPRRVLPALFLRAHLAPPRSQSPSLLWRSILLYLITPSYSQLHACKYVCMYM